MKYVYFVSYATEDGFGNNHIERTGKITNWDTQEVEDFIKKKVGKKAVCLLFYRLLDKDEVENERL